MFNMKLILVIIFLLLLSCKTPTNIVGSDEDEEIKSISLIIDSTYLNGSTMVAKGMATNNGYKKITSPWYIEGQFYTDASHKIKLGGTYTEIGVPLESGQSVLWKLSFSSSEINLREYPNFTVDDVRGIYKE